MSTDHIELLKLAAKAVGLQIVDLSSGGWLWVKPLDGDTYEWNPLEDDGDCARIEAAVGIDVEWHNLGVKCSKFSGGSSPDVIERETFRDHGKDRQAARRLASLRVAAAIGRVMS
ncbi:MAG: hypothetical protein LCH90_19270 [Proteobacteria bacterium]|nr:hypothetical protein [Pseudomonadota bacterium]